MGFGGRFRTEIIPERVYALVKFVSYKKRTREELRDFLQPDCVNESKQIFNNVYNFALENELIKEDPDSLLACGLDDETLKNHNTFRKFMADKLLYKDKGSMFFKYTSWYLAQDKDFFKFDSAKKIQPKLTKEELINLEEVDLLAWRFWAKFLGVGILHQSFVIPNAAIRIKDVIEKSDEIKIGTEISFSNFMYWLLEKCPEFKKGISNNNLSFGVSLGLRNLHDQNLVKMQDLKDASEVWRLVRSDFHDIKDTVSHITIKGGEFYEK